MPKVYVACGDSDLERAGALAAALEQAEVEVFHRPWDLVPGQVAPREIDVALAECRSAVMVLGEAATDTIHEYPALILRALRGDLPLIPVILHPGAPMTELLRAFRPVDFTGADTDERYEACVSAVADALRGAPVPRWASGRPGVDRAVEGPFTVRLRVSATETALVLPNGAEIIDRPAGSVRQIMRQLVGENARGGPSGRDRAGALHRLGVGLGRAFLPGPAGRALTELLTVTGLRNQSLAIGVETREDWIAGLPWEAVLPPGAGRPVGLHPRVRPFRITDLGVTPAPDIPGPLRILVVIAAPDGGTSVPLDYEYELSSVLTRVRAARAGDAHVRVLNWGSLAAIRSALSEERFHVVHVSCHARPGTLLLETADGGVDPVDAVRFAEEALVADRTPPLVVLAGCSTAVTGAENLPGYAATLLRHGVPAVLAMTAPVTDDYATELLSRLYGGLAGTAGSDPLPLLSDLRRTLELERSGTRPPEWHVPALFTRVRSTALYDPVTRAPVPRPTPAVRHAAGSADLSSGDFVGRRTDLRGLLRELRNDGPARGVLLHGIGGIGKSHLAGQLAWMMADAGNVIPVPWPGRATPDELLTAVARRLRSHVSDQDGAGSLSRRLTDPDVDWPDRLDLLVDELRAHGRTVLLLLDDPVTDREADDELRRFLRAWLRVRDGLRIIITAPRADALGMTHPALRNWRLGPLSRAEIGKLIWRLPAVAALTPAEQDRAYGYLGGHPRAFEYLDALLTLGRASGHGRTFPDAVERMTRSLEKRGIDDPERWLTARGADLGTALAATVADISGEVLLDRIVNRLAESSPRARELLFAAAVFRVPVDRRGLSWAVSDPVAPTPERTARLRRWYRALHEVRRADDEATLADVELPGIEEIHRDLAAGSRPPDLPWLDDARAELVALGLLTEEREPDGAPVWIVHRWTAASLADWDPVATRRAHRRAAAYHRWWAGLHAHTAEHRLVDLAEAWQHCLLCGDLDQLVTVAAQWCTVLHSHGLLHQEQIVCTDTIALLRPDHPETWHFTHQLGVIAMRHGRYDDAERHHRTCLAHAESAGDPVAQATSLRELGSVARLRADVAGAEEYYRRAIRCCGDPAVRDSSAALAVLASCYQLCGAMDLAREDGEAWRWSSGALDIAQELHERAGPVDGERDLARLARAAGDTERADAHDLAAAETATYRAEIQRLIATSALQTGAIRLLRGAPRLAVDHLKRAMAAAYQDRDLFLRAQCHRLFADVLFQIGRLEEAADLYRDLAELANQLSDPVLEAVAEQQLGRILGEIGPEDPADAAEANLGAADAIARRLGNRGLIAAGHLYRGELHDRAGHADRARRELGTALDEAESAGDEAVWLAGALLLAGIDARARRPRAAEEWLGLVIGRARDGRNHRVEALAWISLAMLARRDGRTEQAVPSLREAVRSAQAGGHVRTATTARLHLADLAVSADRPEQAEAHFARALELPDPATDPDLVAEVRRRRGRCRARRDDAAGAIADLSAAHRFYARYEPATAAWCLVHLCHMAIRAADEDGLAEWAAQAGVTAARLPDSPLRVVALLAAGEQAVDGAGPLAEALSAAEAVETPPRSLTADCHRSLAHATVGRGALAHLRSAHDIAVRTGDRLGAMHDERHLGRACLAVGDIDEGRRWLTVSADHAETLGDERSARAALALRDGTGGRADITVAESRWRDLRWLRRAGAVDGEQSFAGTARRDPDPPIEQVLRQLGSRHSPAAGVPLAVGPHRLARRAVRS
ncbi:MULTISPECIES: tetratricopeptide repeat protein [Catenuloplanes]|uniref:Tetratricopeptide (TPR) repeat protein n=1 Tax=Catenuloplanes niger TaxID=587534 RepID=A0AAE3ZYL7_9ACTN|nr:tetratricopeptide repeat protein [Catenuloplanes niger]MDR7328282.1 tetratricopeptide (TPR) repeat protein [Catenuloplanes niger]